MIIDGMTIKGRRIIVIESLQNKMLNQLHINHIGKEKRLLTSESIHLVNMNVKIEYIIKNFPICLDFQVTQPKDNAISHEIPGRLWKPVRADIFSIISKHYLCIVDYHSKLPVIMQVKGPVQMT